MKAKGLVHPFLASTVFAVGALYLFGNYEGLSQIFMGIVMNAGFIIFFLIMRVHSWKGWNRGGHWSRYESKPISIFVAALIALWIASFTLAMLIKIYFSGLIGMMPVSIMDEATRILVGVLIWPCLVLSVFFGAFSFGALRRFVNYSYVDSKAARVLLIGNAAIVMIVAIFI